LWRYTDAAITTSARAANTTPTSAYTTYATNSNLSIAPSSRLPGWRLLGELGGI